jgi:hypothetical protein
MAAGFGQQLLIGQNVFLKMHCRQFGGELGEE